MTEQKQIETCGGFRMALGGRELLFAPLTLAAYKRMRTRSKEIMDAEATNPEELIASMTETIHASLVRNYPDMTLGQVEELLDMSSLHDVFTAVATGAPPAPAPAAEAKAG